LVADTSPRLEANKVVGGDDLESSGLVTQTSDLESTDVAKVLNWVQQLIDIESIYDNDAQDQVGELEMKVLVDGKQDEAKVVKLVVVAVEQNIDKPDVEGEKNVTPKRSKRAWSKPTCFVEASSGGAAP
nr:hypothetical protein [Tanacetum cinerariifolium]